MIPINLSLSKWCLIFDTKLKLRYLLSDLKILTQKNPGWSVRNERHTKTDLGSSVRGRQVPLVEVDEVRVHESGFL
jgi:hypothetical protein